MTLGRRGRTSGVCGARPAPPEATSASLLVLLYHNVGPLPRGRALAAHHLPVPRFRGQLRYLKRRGYTFVTAAQALDWLDSSLPDVTHPVLVTFDDGLADLHTYAVPVLQEEQVPALLFMVAGRVGGMSSWMPHPAHRHNPMLTWEQLREFQAAGVSIGSHTLTHTHLTEIPATQAVQELRESKRVLEEHLQEQVTTLAYPFGEFNPAVAQVAQEAGYRAAFSTLPGLNTPETDRCALRRVNIRRWTLFGRKIRRVESK